MKKNVLNSSGFVLVETLIVSVFIMVIFSVLYNNLVPLIGEYEKRENFNDIDGIYNAYWVKRFIEHGSNDLSSILNQVNSSIYCEFKCINVGDTVVRTTCNQFVEKASITKMYITKYNLEDFKNLISGYEENGNSSDSNFDAGFHKYINFLPEYSSASGSLNYANYRVIIEMNRTRDGNNYLAFSTMEVKI